jgi:hypothetical protein
MTRRATVTQAQIERGLRAAKAAMPEQPWRIRITPAEVTIEPAEDQQGRPPSPEVDQEPEIVL